MQDKILLTDADGVLFDWPTKFYLYLESLGYSKLDANKDCYELDKQYGLSWDNMDKLLHDFNHSTEFGLLEPYKDAVAGLQKLESDGWKIIVITTAGLHPATYKLRYDNIVNVFGGSILKELHVLETHGDKGVILKNYQDSNLFWIEDKVSNAELGFKYGLQPLLMDTPYNKNYTGNVPRVTRWAQIYDIITN